MAIHQTYSAFVLPNLAAIALVLWIAVLTRHDAPCINYLMGTHYLRYGELCNSLFGLIELAVLLTIHFKISGNIKNYDYT